jgi:hypothetical protein
MAAATCANGGAAAVHMCLLASCRCALPSTSPTRSSAPNSATSCCCTRDPASTLGPGPPQSTTLRARAAPAPRCGGRQGCTAASCCSAVQAGRHVQRPLNHTLTLLTLTISASHHLTHTLSASAVHEPDRLVHVRAQGEGRRSRARLAEAGKRRRRQLLFVNDPLGWPGCQEHTSSDSAPPNDCLQEAASLACAADLEAAGGEAAPEGKSPREAEGAQLVIAPSVSWYYQVYVLSGRMVRMW